MTNLDIHSGSLNRQHYDDDTVFKHGTVGHRALDFVCHSVRREEEDVRNLAIIDDRDKDRRLQALKSKKDKLWTEVTKDLVSEEAIKEVGYDFEETENFYYVMEYLCSVSINLPPNFYLSCRPNLTQYYRRMFSALSNLPKTSDGIAVNASVRSKQSGKYDSEDLVSTPRSKKNYLQTSLYLRGDYGITAGKSHGVRRACTRARHLSLRTVIPFTKPLTRIDRAIATTI